MFEYSKSSKLKLQRYPLIKHDNFQAWDSADEYVINYVKDSFDNLNKVLIIEDDFGAIGLAIKANNIFFVNDSVLSRKGILENFRNNQSDISRIDFISPYCDFPKEIDLIIIKIPKVNRYLEFLLNKLNCFYSKDIQLIATSKVKYLNSSIYKFCQTYLTDFQYSLSWKKSKIITGKLSGFYANKNFINNLNDYQLKLVNYPNLFSSEKIDIGTRFLLDNIEKIDFVDQISKIIDVGSANGILGLTFHSYFKDSNLWLTDITYSAFESAQATIKMSNLDSKNISLIIDNSLDSFDSEFADLIVLNPPFHDKHKVSIQNSKQIFRDCRRVLRHGGQLIIIANQHLGYHIHLAEEFSEVKMVHKSMKFIILSAIK